MASANDVLRVAASQIGYSRYTDPQAGTKYGRWFAQKTGNSYYGANGVPYCAMFVSWVLDQAGQSVAGFPGAYCPTLRQAAINSGLKVNKYNAQAGDIVFFDWGGDGLVDHVGIVEINHGSYIQTIEGNTSSGTSGSQGNGGGVYRRTRSWGVVNCIIRPHYGVSSNNTTATKPALASDKLVVDGYWGAATVRKLQSALETYVDGVVSAQPLENKKYLASCVASGAWQFTARYGGGSAMVAKLQSKIGCTPDGWFGTNSVKALQRYLGTTVDGTLSEGSECVKAMQRRLNDGTFMNGAAKPAPVAKQIVNVDGWWGKATTLALQKQLGCKYQDGIVSGQAKSSIKYLVRAGNGWEFKNDRNASGSTVIIMLQRKIGATADGFIGFNTIKKLQSFLGVSADGYCGKNTVVALQKAINANRFR